MTILGLGRISGPKPMSADERRARELHPLAFKTEREPANELDRQWREVARRENARPPATPFMRLIAQAAEQEDARALAAESISAPQADPGDETDADARALAEAEAQFERAFGEPVDPVRESAEKNAFYRAALDQIAAAPTPVYVDRKGSATAPGNASGYTTYTNYSGNGGWGDGDAMEAAYADDTRETLTDDEPAEDERIERGDVVQLIIGGPLMLISRIDRSDRTANCVWFDRDDRVQREWFPAEALDHA
jgi:uncharacterized protein YodC (DUF2158 family)